MQVWPLLSVQGASRRSWPGCGSPAVQRHRTQASHFHLFQSGRCICVAFKSHIIKMQIRIYYADVCKKNSKPEDFIHVPEPLQKIAKAKRFPDCKPGNRLALASDFPTASPVSSERLSSRSKTERIALCA